MNLDRGDSFEPFDERREDSAIMIEQLQRELHHTVDAFHHQQKHQQQTQEPSQYMSAPSNYKYDRSSLNLHAPAANSSYSNNTSKFGNDEKSIIVDFIHQSQESAARVQLDSNQQGEVRRLQNDVLSLRDQTKRLIDDLEQMNAARRDAEGKLQFRMRQVIELEQKQLANFENEAKWNKKERELQHEMKKMHSQVAEARVEAKVAVTKSTVLENSLHEYHKKEMVPLELYLKLQKDFEHQRVAFKKSKATVDELKSASLNQPSSQSIFGSEHASSGMGPSVIPSAAGVAAAMGGTHTHTHQPHTGKQGRKEVN